MATVEMSTGVAYEVSSSPINRTPKVVEVVIDFAAAATSKGSALAAADVIECLKLPAGTMVLGAGAEVITAMTGTSTDLALDFGLTGGDVDNFVDGFDYDGAAVGDYTVPATAAPIMVAADDTLDILIAAQTGTLTGGKLRVWALVVNVDGHDRPGVAASGS